MPNMSPKVSKMEPISIKIEPSGARPTAPTLQYEFAGDRILILYWFYVGFCRYLLVLDVFCFSYSCRAALVDCKCVARNPSNFMPKWCRNPSIFIPNPSKIEQMVPRSVPKDKLGSSSVKDPLSGTEAEQKLWGFWRHLAILAATLGPAGRQGGPQIEHFGTRKRQKVKK